VCLQLGRYYARYCCEQHSISGCGFISFKRSLNGMATQDCGHKVNYGSMMSVYQTAISGVLVAIPGTHLLEDLFWQLGPRYNSHSGGKAHFTRWLDAWCCLTARYEDNMDAHHYKKGFTQRAEERKRSTHRHAAAASLRHSKSE
jgi:hypothetical protein